MASSISVAVFLTAAALLLGVSHQQGDTCVSNADCAPTTCCGSSVNGVRQCTFDASQCSCELQCGLESDYGYTGSNFCCVGVSGGDNEVITGGCTTNATLCTCQFDDQCPPGSCCNNAATGAEHSGAVPTQAPGHCGAPCPDSVTLTGPPPIVVTQSGALTPITFLIKYTELPAPKNPINAFQFVCNPEAAAPPSINLPPATVSRGYFEGAQTAILQVTVKLPPGTFNVFCYAYRGTELAVSVTVEASPP